MPEPQDISCERPTSGPVEDSAPAEAPQSQTLQPVKSKPMVRIGQKAPDFNASAFINDGFGSVRLSEHLGQWVVLCFYPGDFTFV